MARLTYFQHRLGKEIHIKFDEITTTGIILSAGELSLTLEDTSVKTSNVARYFIPYKSIKYVMEIQRGRQHETRIC